MEIGHETDEQKEDRTATEDIQAEQARREKPQKDEETLQKQCDFAWGATEDTIKELKETGLEDIGFDDLGKRKDLFYSKFKAKTSERTGPYD